MQRRCSGRTPINFDGIAMQLDEEFAIDLGCAPRKACGAHESAVQVGTLGAMLNPFQSGSCIDDRRWNRPSSRSRLP